MKEIQLTQGKVALVDDEDYEYLNQFRWHAHKSKRTWSVRRNISIGHSKGTVLCMHIVLMSPPKGFEIDHKDHNGLNNQKHNLRCCLNKQNVRNMRIPIDNSTGFKGVCSRKQREHKELKYSAYIQRIHLGHFKTKEEAALAYNKKAKELFGEFACLNQVLRKNK